MNYSYFPGCTLKTKGAQLDKAGRRAAEKLGFSLCEIPEWQCCGAVYPQANDEIATRLSSVRALMAARDAGRPLVSLCSACHHVLKRVNGDMQHQEDIRANREKMEHNLHNSLMLVTALNPYIGYENAAKTAKKAYKENISLKEACVSLGFLTAERFDEVFHPENMI